MKLWNKFWFWYHTNIGMEPSGSVTKLVHHINQAEYHENKIRG